MMFRNEDDEFFFRDPTLHLPSRCYDSMWFPGMERANEPAPKGVLAMLAIAISRTIILAISLAVPMSMSIVGGLYFSDCPQEKYIPIYLLVGGIVYMVLRLINFANKHGQNNNEDVVTESCLITLMYMFLVVWFILGSVWVYKIYEPNYDPKLGPHCNKNLYLFAFWLTTLGYIIVALLVIVFCGFITVFMCKNEKRDTSQNTLRFRQMAVPPNPLRKQIKNQDDLDKEAEHFENQVQVLCGIKKIQITPKKVGPNKQKISAVNLKNKNEIRGLYSHQSHRAVQEILFGPTSYCLIDPVKIEKYYTKLLSTEEKCYFADLPQSLWKKNIPNNIANSLLVKDFTSKEVKAKLQAKIYSPLYSSRSVGLDRISFTDLRYADSNSDFFQMTNLFNACLKLQTVPKIWMEFYSVLIKTQDKSLENSDDADDNDPNNDDSKIKNWHTVTMQRTILKLFQSLLASRLIIWAKTTERLSATQKGFLMHDAACESSFVLQQCKSHAQNQEKSLAIAWLDFADASDFIPQSAILQSLEKHSVPCSIIKIIENMLEFSNTKIRVIGPFPFTKPIKILKGLPQGSPMNPILLDLVIEPILTHLLSVVNNYGFEIHNKKINHYAIPNELTLIADSPSELQSLLNLVENDAKLIGLKFNIHKCSTYHYDGKAKEVKSDGQFVFFGRKLNTLSNEEIDKYFGVKQALSLGQEGFPSIEEMVKHVDSIDESLLEFYQKIESVLMYIVPRVENYLRGLENPDKNHIITAEQVLKDKFKKWLDLPDNASNESIVYQVAAMKQSMKEDMKKSIKYDYLPFMDIFYIMKIVHALKMLTSQDQIVKTIAFVTLTAEVNSLIPNKKKINVTRQHLAQYLSGDLNVKSIETNSLWYIAREATLKLKIKIPLAWEYNNRMQLVIREDRKIQNILSGRNPCTTEEKLKHKMVEYYIDHTLKNNPGPSENLKAVVKVDETKKRIASKRNTKRKNVKRTVKKVPQV